MIDGNGKQVGAAQFTTTTAGNAALAAFVLAFGAIIRVRVEGTGSYGDVLTRDLRNAGIDVAEVLRPNRQLHRMRGKPEPLDAYMAACTTRAFAKPATPKTGTGPVETIR